ncbi:MAG: pantoate--beta-alanine ligase, partial [Acidimicrobiales bacterium]
IRRARAECDVVGVSIYVNPLQFDDPRDLAAYPRDLERDLDLAESAGAGMFFAPADDEMRPASTSVSVGGLSERWEGAARPGHFDGVATVVTRLFSLTGPCYAYFGEKDFQQLVIVRRLVEDLGLPVEVVGCSTVRQVDGLALSSRNERLSAGEREAASRLYWALLAGKRAVEIDEETDPQVVAKVMSEVVNAEPQLDLEYAVAVEPRTLEVPERLSGESRLLVAARLGPIRLIDNLPTTVPEAA